MSQPCLAQVPILDVSKSSFIYLKDSGSFNYIKYNQDVLVDYCTLAQGIIGLMPPQGHQVQPKGWRPKGCTWCPRAASNPLAQGIGCNNHINIQRNSFYHLMMDKSQFAVWISRSFSISPKHWKQAESVDCRLFCTQASGSTSCTRWDRRHCPQPRSRTWGSQTSRAIISMIARLCQGDHDTSGKFPWSPSCNQAIISMIACLW